MILKSGKRGDLRLKSFGNISYRVPGGQVADEEDCKKNPYQIRYLNTNGVGVNNKRTATLQLNNTELLLYPADQGSQYQSGESSEQGYHPSFIKKNPS